MGDLFGILLLALLAAANPTLLAAVTVLMLLPNTKRLMLGYLLGAYLTSISVGLLIAFSLDDSAFASTSKDTLGPGADLLLGVLALVAAYALGGSRAEGLRERRRSRAEAKSRGAGAAWPVRMLGRGSARVSFAVGLLLSFPGVSYLTALDRIAELDTSAAPTVLLVVGFCLIQQLLLEIPLLGYAFAPARTERAVAGFRGWLDRNWRHAATLVAATIGALLVLRGAIELLAG